MCHTILEYHQPTPVLPRDWRRRSADVGGLHLATANKGQGQGWMGGDPAEIETTFAELLSDMHTETLNSVNDNSLASPPPDVPDSVRSRLIRSLGRWHFEPHMLPDEEAIACSLILFEALFRVEGMKEAVPLSMQQISAFIHHLRRIYRLENTYHNFEHALDVLQATQSYLKSAKMVPPPDILLQPNQMWKPKPFNNGSLVSCLGLREMFMLYIASIGHDVGHPGFTNRFMQNANTPLSLVFGHNSALEQMHCQLLLRVMRHHGLGILLDDPLHGNHLKKILLQSVLATDMGIHADFMLRLQQVADGEAGPLCVRQIITCQAILKNADISNPTRPYQVSKHWAKALMQEWTAQALLEEEFNLKQTVMSSDDPLKEAESQIFFITTFAKPLLELTAKVVPELSLYSTVCKQNLKTWTRIKADLVRERQKSAIFVCPSTTSFPTSPPPLSSASSASQLSSLPPPSPRQFDYYHTAFPLTLPTFHLKLPSDHSYPPSCLSRSDNEPISFPDSPTESESVTSSMFSPTSDSSSSNKCPSASGSVLSLSNGLSMPTLHNTTHEAIRVASRLGSLPRMKKDATGQKGSRNSWSVATSSMAGGLSTLFRSPSPLTNSVSGPGSACPTATGTPVPPALHTPPPPSGGFLMARPLKLHVSP